VRNWSVWLDIIILARTVKVLLEDPAVPMQIIRDTDVRAAITTLRGREEKGEEETKAEIEMLERLLE
jgi:hypothetical protein